MSLPWFRGYDTFTSLPVVEEKEVPQLTAAHMWIHLTHKFVLKYVFVLFTKKKFLSNFF